MVPRSVEDAPARRSLGVRPAALLAILLLAASAQALEVNLDAYRDARRAGALGAMAGRAVAEPRSLSAAAQPLTGTIVAVLPRSEALMARLERLKEGARESSTAFAAAAPAMRRTREAYERELWEAGAPDLTPTVLVDAEGGFRIDDLPAGAWLVFAWRTMLVDVSGEKLKARERSLFLSRARLRGFQSVTIWLRAVELAGGATARIELTDRNAWFRGVVEERAPDTGR